MVTTTQFSFPLLEHLPDAVIVATRDNVIRYANQAITRLLGWAPDDLVGQPLTVLIPPRLRDAHMAGFRRFADSGALRHAGAPMRVAALHRAGDEIDIDLNLAKLPSGEEFLALAALRDVGQLAALERELLVSRYLRANIEVSAALQQAANIDAAYDMLLPALCQHLDWQLAAIWQPDPEIGRLTCVVRWHDGALPRAAQDMTDNIALRFGEGLPGQVWRSRQPVLVATAASEFPRASIAARHGLASGLGFALLGTSGTLGVIEFWSSHPHEFDDDLRSVLLSIGQQLGLFLERVAAEAELRRTIDVLQTSLLPTALPSIAGIALGAHYQPAGGGVAVGGDFFDAFPLPANRWMFVIADVCGKGAGAAAVTAMARYTIRAAAQEHDDPREIMRILNTAMRGDATDRPFLTACLVDVRREDDGAVSATVTAAGHPLPLLRAANGKVSQVGEPGDLLGVLADPVFTPTIVDLAPGDVLLLYTDGFTEARDHTGRQLGDAGLARLLGDAPAHDPEAILDALVDALARHTDARHTTDDAAALAIGVERPQEQGRVL